MINLRARKIIRDIWDYKTRTLLVILTIAIGVFAVSSLGRVWVILSRNLSSTFLAADPASATLTTTRTFEQDIVDRVERMPEVSVAQGRNGTSGRIWVGGNKWQSVQLFAFDDYDEISINRIRPEAGEWPPDDDTILLERSSLSLIPFDIGDTLTIEFSNGEREELQLTGTVHDITQISSSFSLLAYWYITSDTLRELTDKEDFTTLDIIAAEDRFSQSHLEDVVEEVTDVLEANNYVVSQKEIPPPGKHDLDNIMQSVLLLLAILCGLALLLSAFLVVNIISALLIQQTQQIGTMKAVGGVSRQMMVMYIGLVVLFGLIALVVAVPCGIAFSRFNADFFARLINFEIVDYAVRPENILLELFAGIAIPVLAAFYPIIKAARLTVRESVGFSGGSQSAQFGVSGFEKLLSQIPGLPATILYPFRNIFRRKVRLALATLTLSVAGAILIAVVSVRASFLNTLDDIESYWQEDISVSFYDMQQFDRLERFAMSIPGVEYVEPRLTQYAFRVRDDDTESTRTIDLFGVEPGSPFIEPQIVEGRWLLPEDEAGVVVNIDLLDMEPDIAVGDVITLKIDGRETEWTVVGITTSQVIGGGDLLMSPIGYVNYPYLAQVVRAPGRTNRILIGTTRHTPRFYKTVVNDLEVLFAQRSIYPASALDHDEIRNALTGAFEILLSLLQIMAIIFGAVGGLGLMSMMSLNVLERIREVGIIRSIGGVRKQLAQIIVIEGVFVGLLSWVVSTILAYPLSTYLGNALGQTLLRTPLKMIFPFTGPLLWLVLVIILSIVSSLLPGRSASRLSIRETLAYE
jgi:putative ABC transport system permease protein